MGIVVVAAAACWRPVDDDILEVAGGAGEGLAAVGDA